ncbi:MAG: DUF4910 domain-containing protein, partial [Lentisphaeria bacterium]|nr:DUF4910 domain-containing protein [Lentisphaeria bacterium]
MENLFKKIRSHLDAQMMAEKTEELCRIEMGQTFRHYHQAIDWICAEMKKVGIPNVERLVFPADGKTVYEDKRMPIAWDASIGKLTLCDAEQTVAADFTQHPFHLIKGSVSTLPGGEIVRIITEQQFLAGEDPRGAMVMLETTTSPRAAVISPILDQGGRGIIADYLVGRYEHPDGLQWVNACTEGAHWHIQEEDRDFVGFSVTLRMGDKIRQLANRGGLKARIECDGRRYVGELPAATALIPGRRKEEIWLLAHTFEPLLDDDSNGVVAGIEIAKQIMSMGTPEYSLRLVFAMELYGFAAFHANFKGKVIGGANLDSIPVNSRSYCQLIPPISSVPFHGVKVLKELSEAGVGQLPCKLKKPECFDDMFLSDSTTGVPTVWFLKGLKPGFQELWHNSAQTEKGYLEPEILADFTALAAVWFHRVLFYTGAPAELPKLELKPISSPWRDYAAGQIYARAQIGLPQDLVMVPKAMRKAMPERILYGPMVSLLSGMDGKKNLAQIILETEAERQVSLTDAQIKKYIDAINYLTDWGYLKAVKRTELTPAMLADSMRQAGVKAGDVLLVHSSLSKCGYIAGGAEGLIRGVMEAVGQDGTALFPTFTRPYIYLGSSLNKGWNYRPYDPNDPSQVWTGIVPRVLLEKFPEAKRSRHVTHSWAGLGLHAETCVSVHGPVDPPASHASPLAKAMELGGKVVYIGSGLAPSTFLHYLETVCNSAFLQPAVCRVKNPDGSLHTVFIEQHLPGHRDFYRPDAENCKFFLRAVKAGLKIAEVP